MDIEKRKKTISEWFVSSQWIPWGLLVAVTLIFTGIFTPNMVAINSAIGVDLHGNIWADSLNATQIYSGIGGQSDFLRGAYLSEGGVPIIALKSTTTEGSSKILDKSPEGISATATAADPPIKGNADAPANPPRLRKRRLDIAMAGKVGKPSCAVKREGNP